MTFPDLLILFFPQVIFLVLGLGAVLLLRVEPSNKQDIPASSIPYAYVPKTIYSGIRFVGLLFIVFSIGWSLLVWFKAPLDKNLDNNSDSVPSIVSIRYVSTSSSGLRRIDLATVEIDGIPVSTKSTFGFQNIVVRCPEDSVGYKAQIEFFANDEPIGQTEEKYLVPGNNEFETVATIKYQDDSYPHRWIAQPGWGFVRVVLNYYDNLDRQTGSNGLNITLNSQGKSWLVSPPIIRILAIAYSINHEAEQLFDLRNQNKWGLPGNEGDTITIRSVWYKSDSSSSTKTVYAHISLYEKTTIDGQLAFKSLDSFETTPQSIKQGIYSLNGFPYSFVLADNTTLYVYLYVKDGNEKYTSDFYAP